MVHQRPGLGATGDQVLFEGLPYEARRNNKDDVPATLFPVGPTRAWRPLVSQLGKPERVILVVSPYRQGS